MNRYIIQRVLGVRDINASSRGAMLAGGLKLLPLFLMTLPGAMAIPLLPHLKHADQVWPELVTRFEPQGFAGHILAGLLAALMSTCSSTLNSAATLLTADFIQLARPEWTSARLAWTGRVLTLTIALAAALGAPMIAHFQGLRAYLQQIFAYVASPLVAVFVFGLASRSLGPRAALRGLVSGHVLSAALFVSEHVGWVSIHFTVIGGILFALTLLLTWGWMLLLGNADRPVPDGPQLALIRRVRLPRLPRDLTWAAGAILLGIAALLWVFW